ncbi:MAG: hypothetical protein M1834_002611 [Cirrosporium novae-zelandiae]|nr:MAG: hypothetical protein M1834_002611 [Cirrosporium novae-zelandiae]
MSNSRLKKQPSAYPPLPFHIIRGLQLISSMVVSGIMFYFMYHLKHDSYKIPWTFLLLLAVSLCTIVALCITMGLYIFRTLNPMANLIANAILSLLWVVGFGLLSWNMSGTLTAVCNVSNWGNSLGMMVCRIYKALFSFALFGTLSTIAAVLIDASVRKRQAARGAYDAMDVKLVSQDPSAQYPRHSRNISYDDREDQDLLQPQRGRDQPYHTRHESGDVHDHLMAAEPAEQHEQPQAAYEPYQHRHTLSDYSNPPPPEESHYDPAIYHNSHGR